MADKSKTKAQLIDELNLLRNQVQELDTSDNGHKHANQTQREDNERFRRLSEATFEGIAITEKGVIIDANERFAEMLGYSLKETIGMNVIDLVAPESRELVQERILSGYESPYEHRALRKDKSAKL